MEPTITCGRHLAQHADISGSRFLDVNLAGAEFNDVNLAEARVHNVNMSDMAIDCVQMGGTSFRHVGLPPDQPGAGKQRPLAFEECDLNGSTFKKVDLSGVSITACNLEGATIDGVLVSDLIAAYRKQAG
jgi:uncharacterized protein YjbI with pentapeptide repeats